MSKSGPNWQFVVPDSSAEFRLWSYGKVENKSDLYDPKIFGPKDDLKCECGKLSGQDVIDIVCDRCGVRVCSDAALVRKQRSGHIELACWCPHPLDNDVTIESFPIAPIGYRTEVGGTPNSLGKKYETFVEANTSLAEKLPRKGSTEYYAAGKEADVTELRAAMAEIIGIGKGDNEKWGLDAEDCLLWLLIRSIVGLDPNICSIVRSCGCTLKLDTTV